MKITVTKPKDLYQGNLSILLDTKVYTNEVNFGSGEPEDMNLARDLSDAFNIEKMLIASYEAGKRGEPIKIIYEKEEDDG